MNTLLPGSSPGDLARFFVQAVNRTDVKSGCDLPCNPVVAIAVSGGKDSGLPCFMRLEPDPLWKRMEKYPKWSLTE